MTPARVGMLIAAALGVGVPGAAAASPAAPAATFPVAIERVRVGEREGEAGAAPPAVPAIPASRTIDCERTKALIARLGETYAGHRLRLTLVDRACPPDEAERVRSSVWAWPWSADRIVSIPPPELAAEAGAWQVRCATLARRRRCALVAARSLPAGVGSHFVLDRIAGQEALVWRVYVPGDGSPGLRAGGETGAVSATAADALAFDLASGRAQAPFTHCDAGGCMLEASLRHASEVAGQLAGGRDVPIAVGNARAPAMVLEAAGFRDGLRQLVKLRREEPGESGGR